MSKCLTEMSLDELMTAFDALEAEVHRRLDMVSEFEQIEDGDTPVILNCGKNGAELVEIVACTNEGFVDEDGEVHTFNRGGTHVGDLIHLLRYAANDSN